MARVAVIIEPGRLELQDRPAPLPADDQVLVRVSLCGICGSDLAVFRGQLAKKFPYSPGHEFCGRIERVGSGVRGFQPGQMVVIDPNLGCGRCRYCAMGRPNLCDSLKSRTVKSNGGFAEYVALDQRMIHAVPAGMTETLATYAEPFSCALHVARAVQSGSVAVFGGGLLGMLVILAMKQTACAVTLVEPSQSRRQRAQAVLGVQALTPEEFGQCEAFGTFDNAIDCSGQARAVAQAIQALAKAGRLVLAGIVGELRGTAPSLADVTTKELEIRGVWLNPGTFGDALHLVIENRQALESIETEVFTLDNIAAAFECAARTDLGKILVRP